MGKIITPHTSVWGYGKNEGAKIGYPTSKWNGSDGKLGNCVSQIGQKGNFTKTRSICFPLWMASAVDHISNEIGMSFNKVVLELLRQELAVMGYNAGIGGDVYGTNWFPKE